MKILSIDVGIKNLAFCLFEKSPITEQFKITKWDTINKEIEIEKRDIRLKLNDEVYRKRIDFDLEL